MFRQIIFPILLVLLLPVWLRLLIKLRLGVALAYVVLGNTLLLDWTAQHTTLADSILFAILGGDCFELGRNALSKTISKRINN